MSLTPEDKKDVSKAYGKALANKVSKATKDKRHRVDNSLTGQAARERVSERKSFGAMYKASK